MLFDAADRRRAQAFRAVTVLVVLRARAGAAVSLRFDDRMHVCNEEPIWATGAYCYDVCRGVNSNASKSANWLAFVCDHRRRAVSVRRHGGAAKDELVASVSASAGLQLQKRVAARPVKIEDLFGLAHLEGISADPVDLIPPPAHAAVSAVAADRGEIRERSSSDETDEEFPELQRQIN